MEAGHAIPDALLVLLCVDVLAPEDVEDNVDEGEVVACTEELDELLAELLEDEAMGEVLEELLDRELDELLEDALEELEELLDELLLDELLEVVVVVVNTVLLLLGELEPEIVEVEAEDELELV